MAKLSDCFGWQASTSYDLTIFATSLDPGCSKTEEVRRSCNHISKRMLMTKLKKERNYNLKDY